jgi:hypothetical protein
MFTEFGKIPEFLRPGMRRVRLIGLFALWTLVTCALSVLANTGYITVTLQDPGNSAKLLVRFGYLYEMNCAFLYLLVIPWFIYFSIGFVLEAQVALATLAGRDQLILNRLPSAPGAGSALERVADAHRKWMSRPLLGILLFGMSLVVVGTEYLPPNSDYKHVMFGYVQAPWIADYPAQCPGCTLGELARKLDRRLEPLGGRSVAQLSEYRIVKPHYSRSRSWVESTSLVLFIVSVLGLEVAFSVFKLWVLCNAIFFLRLIYRAVAPSAASPLGLHLRFTDPGRMFGLESVHRALRQYVAAIIVSVSMIGLSWWTNILKGSRHAFSEELFSLGGLGRFLTSDGSFIMALAMLIYLVSISGKARDAASEHSKRIAAIASRARGWKNLDQLQDLIAGQSIWSNPRYTAPYVLTPLVCVAAVLMLTRPGVADWIGNLWEPFLRFVLGRE